MVGVLLLLLKLRWRSKRKGERESGLIDWEREQLLLLLEAAAGSVVQLALDRSSSVSVLVLEAERTLLTSREKADDKPKAEQRAQVILLGGGSWTGAEQEEDPRDLVEAIRSWYAATRDVGSSTEGEWLWTRFARDSTAIDSSRDDSTEVKGM